MRILRSFGAKRRLMMILLLWCLIGVELGRIGGQWRFKNKLSGGWDFEPSALPGAGGSAAGGSFAMELRISFIKVYRPWRIGLNASYFLLLTRRLCRAQ